MLLVHTGLVSVCNVHHFYLMYVHGTHAHSQVVSDPLLEAQKRRQIAGRLDEYHQRQFKSFIYSPARQDPFADGKSTVASTSK